MPSTRARWRSVINKRQLIADNGCSNRRGNRGRGERAVFILMLYFAEIGGDANV